MYALYLPISVTSCIQKNNRVNSKNLDLFESKSWVFLKFRFFVSAVIAHVDIESGSFPSIATLT